MLRMCAPITKSQEEGRDLWRWSHLSTCSWQGHLRTAGCLGPCPAGFLISPRTETPHPLWATSANAQSSSHLQVDLQPYFHQPHPKEHIAQISCLLQQKAETPWQDRCDSFYLCCTYLTKREKTSNAKASNQAFRRSSKQWKESLLQVAAFNAFFLLSLLFFLLYNENLKTT